MIFHMIILSLMATISATFKGTFMQSPTLERILSSNPLAVLMVLEALNQFSAKVAASDPSDYPSRGLVNPDAWIQLGKEIQTELNK